MLKVDLHTHTVASKHAFNTLQEMVEEAVRRGVEILGIADHGPGLADGASLDYFKVGARRLPKVLSGVRILFGIEANILDENGSLGINEDMQKELDFVIASLHKPVSSNPKTNTTAIINAMKNPYVKIIGHPYIVNKDFDFDTEKIAEAACQEDVLLEINSAYFCQNKSAETMEIFYARVKKMAEILKAGGKKMIINSDAHHSSEIGRDEIVREKFDYLGITENDIINYDIEAVKKYFNIV